MINYNSLADSIRQIAVNAVNQQKPVEIVYGNCVASTHDNPPDTETLIKVDDKLTLGITYFITVGAIEPHKGDIYVMARYQGGQKYVILGIKGALT